MFYILLLIQMGQINKLKNGFEAQTDANTELRYSMFEKNQYYNKTIENLRQQITKLQQDQEQLREPTTTVNRGVEQPIKRTMDVTAYDLSYESCGKYSNHPEYGITASGEIAKAWYTVAAGKSIPFGTKVYIPFFKDKPNKGIFTVTDRGGGVDDGQIDVYMKSYKDCIQFGRQKLEVWILG